MNRNILEKMLMQCGDNVEFVLKTPIHGASRLFTKNDGGYLRIMDEFAIVVPVYPERFELRFESVVMVPFTEIAYVVDAAYKTEPLPIAL